MPERMVVDISSKLCKFAPRKNNEVIKIDTEIHKRRTREDEIFHKEVFGKEKVGFTDSLVTTYTKEEADKLERFVRYLEKINSCVNCRKKIRIEEATSNDHDEIVLTCKNCLTNVIDGTSLSKDYVIWFNKILDNYGMNFQQGFPRAIKAQWGTICPNCQGSHDGGTYHFDFIR